MSGIEMHDAEYHKVPFAYMVATLFKKMGDMKLEVLHAAVGISTEAAELLGADTRKNIIEEMGDAEFYVQALVNVLGLTIDPSKMAIQDMLDTGCFSNSDYDTHVRNVVKLSGDLLDIAKKSWVYTREVDLKKVELLVAVLYFNFGRIYDFINTNTDEVIGLNKTKLIGPEGRFKGMKYSDDAANARADKKPGEDRNFIGSKN